MEERKAYFDLVFCKEVGLTDDEILERGGFTRFVSLGKWDLFYEENIDTIVNNVQTHYKDEDGTKVPFYTVRTNTGAAGFNTYTNQFSSLRVSAANLYIEKRVGGEIN